MKTPAFASPFRVPFRSAPAPTPAATSASTATATVSVAVPAFARPLLPLLLLMLLLLLTPAAARAGDRVALILGNDAYPGAARLSNAVRDATAVRELLRDRLAFAAEDLVFGTDLDREGLFDKLAAFKKAAEGADIALVYYAGHGMESLDGRETYLIPTDADLAGAVASESRLRATGVRLSELLEEVGQATTGAKVILLDCCRDRPLARTLAGSAIPGGGLAVLTDDRIPADTFILLAAAPNRQASDGVRHGPFTQALLEVLPVAGQSMFDAFFAVSDHVQEATQKEQVPWLKFDGSGAVFRKNALVRGAVKVVAAPTEPPAVAPAPAMTTTKTTTSSPPGTTTVPQPQPQPQKERLTVAMPPQLIAPATEGTGGSLESGAIGDSRSIALSLGNGRDAGRTTLKYVPGGEFLMGRPPGQGYLSRDADNANQVTVTLSSHFWLAETELTQGQWVALRGTTPEQQRLLPKEDDDLTGPGSLSVALGADHPMSLVNHQEALDLVDQLNAQGGLPAGWRWSLPTEAQWERACRAGTETIYHFGDDFDLRRANCSPQHPDKPLDTTLSTPTTTRPVKSYPPNAYGLYDMHGNVGEWCLDGYTEKNHGGTDPVGSPQLFRRVVRGSSWYLSYIYAASADRHKAQPSRRISTVGLRLAVVRAK